MRTLYLLLLFTLFGFPSLAQFNSQWQWLNPKPSGFSNVKVCFSDADNGFVFNDQGELIRTTDGGRHWSIQQSFPNAKTMDLRDSTGLIAGFSNAIFLSTDNGKNWQRKVISATQNPYFSFVQVLSRDTLLAVNSNDHSLFRSTDRGLTWTTVENILLNNIRSFHFINSKTGYIGRYGGVYKTTDGGLTWQNVYAYASWAVLAICFYNENTGYASTEDDKLLKTTDGGKTWTTSSSYFDVYSFFYVNANIIYASGGQAQIYKSSDGGATWKTVSPVFSNYGYGYNAVYFVSETNGFVVGTSGKILSTSDGGINWQQYGVTYTDITSFQFPTAKVGYASDWYSVYKSTDGGFNWQPANLTLPNTITNSRFTHCWFRNKDTGFVISKKPVAFYKTYNGGQSWQVSNPLLSGYDNAICMSFVNDTTGYLTLDRSTADQIYKTTDGGETWKPVAISYDRFSQMDFVSEKTGYAVNDHKVYKSIDSAKTWKVIDNQDNSGFWLNGVYFINENVGYSYAGNGFMQKTIDGGTTWSRLGVPYGHISNAHFFNEQVGYINSDTYNNGILKTYDGGKTWHHQLLVTGLHMLSTSDTVMYIAGPRGAMLAQTIQDYNLDSLQIKNITSCSAKFSASVSVALGRIDSIQLEYGIGAFTNSYSLSPASVVNTTVQVTKTLENLIQNTEYVFRLKCFYKGKYIYSPEGSFKTYPLPKPVIRISGDTLISSAWSDNQWFFNGQPISGANNTILKPVESGNYAVQVNGGAGCLSEMSDAVLYVEPVFNEEIIIAPNPVIDNVYIQNARSRSLIITIRDLAGHIVYSARSNNRVIKVPLVNFRNGLYLITVTDSKTKESITKKIIKL